MYGHRPKNKGRGMVGRVPKHREPDEPVRSTYVYDPKNNTDTRLICKTCVYRELINNQQSCCMCMARSGVPRDTNTTNNHCATYKFGAAKKKVKF